MASYPTAAVGLFKFVYFPSQGGTSLMTLQMSGCMILFIPILILFLVFKDVFMGNLTVGGIKG
jgi:ABC-type glycerol-3-phosphate transport system permease component